MNTENEAMNVEDASNLTDLNNKTIQHLRDNIRPKLPEVLSRFTKVLQQQGISTNKDITDRGEFRLDSTQRQSSDASQDQEDQTLSLSIGNQTFLLSLRDQTLSLSTGGQTLSLGHCVLVKPCPEDGDPDGCLVLRD